MAKSDYLESQIINHIFRTSSFTKPTSLHIALLTAAPDDTGGGTEVSGGSYARVATGPGDTVWSAPSAGNGQTSNVNAITFPAPTAAWGLVTHFAIYDAATVGNLLYHGALTQSKTVNSGDAAPSFPAGTLTVTES